MTAIPAWASQADKTPIFDLHWPDDSAYQGDEIQGDFLIENDLRLSPGTIGCAEFSVRSDDIEGGLVIIGAVIDGRYIDRAELERIAGADDVAGVEAYLRAIAMEVLE